MGQAGVDVRMESAVLREFPFSVECKWQEKWSVPEWIEQAQKNRLPGTYWLLVMKRSRKDPVVVLDAGLFFEILNSEKVRDHKQSLDPDQEETTA